MPKYHVLPQSGDVVTCRGRKHCPVLPIKDHATDKVAAVELHEIVMAKFLAEANHVNARVTPDPRVKTVVPELQVCKTEEGVTYVPNYHEYRAAMSERDAEEVAVNHFPRPRFSFSSLFSKQERAERELMERFWFRYDDATHFSDYPYTESVAWIRELDYPTKNSSYSTLNEWDSVFALLLFPWTLFGKNRVTVKAATPEQFSALRTAQAHLSDPVFRPIGCKC